MHVYVILNHGVKCEWRDSQVVIRECNELSTDIESFVEVSRTLELIASLGIVSISLNFEYSIITNETK